jgi:hypothetical protein
MRIYTHDLYDVLAKFKHVPVIAVVVAVAVLLQ